MSERLQLYFNFFDALVSILNLERTKINKLRFSDEKSDELRQVSFHNG